MELKYSDRAHAYWLDRDDGEGSKRCKGVSTLAKVPDDTYNLDKWGKRMVALGMALGGEPLKERALAHHDDRDELDGIAEDALRQAKAGEAAARGTAIHRILERHDLGEEIIDTPENRAFRAAYDKALDAAGLTVVPEYVERVIVLPKVRVAGRFDRIFRRRRDGKLVIGDVKGLEITTPIPTPTGMSSMGELLVGDEVFAADGTVCRVIAKSEPSFKNCYRITFDDGSSLVADAEHLWQTETDVTARTRTMGTHTTEEIRKTLRSAATGQRHHRIPVAEPLDLPEADLSIDPYVLGAWLGDGNRSRGVITKPIDHPIWQAIEECGYTLGKAQIDKRTGCASFTVLGLQPLLEAEGVLGNKHIPIAYLRASTEQRLSLLQGLMDTDGSWHKARHQAVISTVDKARAEQLVDLTASLGLRPYLTAVNRTGFGKTVASYQISVSPTTCNPFRARDNEARQMVGDSRFLRSTRRLVMSVTQVPSVRTQCIVVDSPDHSYLCGERMIPTHNSGTNAVKYPHSTAVQLAVYANADLIAGDIPRAGGTTNAFEKLPDKLDKNWGYVVHAPSPDKVEVVKVDIKAGWKIATQAIFPILDWRARRDLIESVGTASVADVLAPATEERLSWVRGRLRMLTMLDNSDAAKRMMADRWPEGIPTPKQLPARASAPEWSDLELDAISEVLESVEKACSVGFPTADPAYAGMEAA